MSSLFGTKEEKKRKNKNDRKRKQAGGSDDDESSRLAVDVRLNEQGPRITHEQQQQQQQQQQQKLSPWCTFADLGLTESLVQTCTALGFKNPTPVQRTIIPYLLQHHTHADTRKNSYDNDRNNNNSSSSAPSHVLALAATGSGKTAAFVLPILHHLSYDPYGIYAVIVSPTRELAKQIHQQILALGSSYHIEAALIIGGMDSTKQSSLLQHRHPHFLVATPGRLGELLRGPAPPSLRKVQYLVFDEADRLLTPSSGFERDVAEIILHCNGRTTTTPKRAAAGSRKTQQHCCQTLLFSATMTHSLESLEDMAGTGKGRLPLQKFIIKNDEDDTDDEEEDDNANDNDTTKKKLKLTPNTDDNADDTNTDDNKDTSNQTKVTKIQTKNLTPKIPAGLKQEYVFMPSRVRDAYLFTTIRTLLSNGGRSGSKKNDKNNIIWKGGKPRERKQQPTKDSSEDDDDEVQKARSVIVFVGTCERAALISEILTTMGVQNVALYSILSQNRRMAALAKFKSCQVRVLVATDIASRGLDVPSVDLVINAELPRKSIDYVHRVGRTARAGRRGRAVSLVSEHDVTLVHAAEQITGRPLLLCPEITEDAAIKMLGPVTKAARLAKMKLMDIGFEELLQKFKERKVRDRKDRQRIEKMLRKQQTKSSGKHKSKSNKSSVN